MSSSVVLPEVPVKEIFEALRKTPAGKSLQNMLRFGPYRDSSESPTHWRRVLGPSSASYTHMKFVHSFLKKRIEIELKKNPDFFSAEERELLLFAACCHDFGEAKLNGEGVGDILFIWKKKEDEQKEHAMFETVIEILTLEPKLKERLKEAYYKVVKNEESNLFKFFKSVEKIEYIHTILRVYKKCTNGYKIRFEKLLVGNVLLTHIPDVISLTKKFASIKDFVEKNASLITAALKNSSKSYIEHDPNDPRKTGDFKKVYDQWMNFLDNN